MYELFLRHLGFSVEDGALGGGFPPPAAAAESEGSVVRFGDGASHNRREHSAASYDDTSRGV